MVTPAPVAATRPQSAETPFFDSLDLGGGLPGAMPPPFADGILAREDRAHGLEAQVRGHGEVGLLGGHVGGGGVEQGVQLGDLPLGAVTGVSAPFVPGKP